MNKNSEKVKSWRQRTKQRIVQSFGGKCGICGYDKCDESLDLHHLDPLAKEFGIGKVRANPMSWDKIVQELRKCVLVCRNCHGEIHFNGLEVSHNIQRFDETFADYLKIQEEDRRQRCYNSCPVCGKEKFHVQKTCSLKCAASLTHSIEWNKFDLNDLYNVKGMSVSGISKIVECSPGAVVKRLRKLGLK